MAFIPNEEQKAAIELRNMELLVSASAGAGKTGSLCRRIVCRLCDKKDALDLRRVLVVTFTRAAALEMRTRVGKELREKIALLQKEQTEESLLLAARLKEQLLLLPLARIGTIDSFCLDLIKANFEKLDISPSVRVADETELKRIKEGIMRRMMGRLHGEDPEAFGQLTDGLLSVYGDEELPETLIRFYENTLSYPEGINCLRNASDLARKDSTLSYFESQSGKIAGEKTLSEFDFYIREYGRFIEYAECSQSLEKQRDFAAKEQKALCTLRDLLKSDPAQFVLACEDYEFATLPSSKDKSLTRAYFKRLRDGAKTLVKDRAAGRTDYDLADSKRQLSETAELLELYFKLFSLYEKELSQRKKRMGVVEFSDILLLAEKLLYEESGEISAFAKELAGDFDEIYIDEFQDVNDLQERVFVALSRGNRFLVGDVKQSIYGFRGACPDIFSSMRASLADFSKGEEKGKLFLTYNYRSVPAVIAFVNAVCGKLLSLCKDMTYFEEDDLKAGREEAGFVKPTLCLIENSKKSTFLADAPNKEAAYTAECISGMIKKGRAPADIAILVRSRGKALQDLLWELEKRGVDFDAGQGEGFFDRPEILLICALLESIDNPTHDIALASVMKSPVFGFSLEELTVIRRQSKSESLFSAVCEYAEGEHDEKTRGLLAFLLRYRALLREQTVDKVLWQLYDELALIPLLGVKEDAQKKGEIGKSLLCFYDLASAFVQTAGGDIGGFLEYIEQLSKSAKGAEGGGAKKVEGKVRIMTFHGSKGLQAPVCWLYGCGNRLSLGGKSIPFDRSFGPGFVLTDREQGVLTSKSSFYHAIKTRAQQKGLDEELRLLYVALTRAEEELYISGIATQKLLDLVELAGEMELQREHLELFNTPCYLSFLLMALEGREKACRILCSAFPPELLQETDCALECLQEEALKEDDRCDKASPELVKRYEKRLNFEYPYSQMVDLQTKLSVSVLSPGVLDEQAQGSFVNLLESEKPIPSFCVGKDRAFKKDGAKIGTATHAFMQFCDFEAVEKEGVKKEISRLLAGGFLDERTASLVDENAVKGFFESQLYRRMKRARKVFREQRFMYELEALELTEDPLKKQSLDGETVLVQGVIDCFFIDEEGRAVLLDYKTDGFSEEQKKDLSWCRKELVRRHRRQLEYYKAAVEGLLSMPVFEVFLYSFSLSESVPIGDYECAL